MNLFVYSLSTAGTVTRILVLLGGALLIHFQYQEHLQSEQWQQQARLRRALTGSIVNDQHTIDTGEYTAETSSSSFPVELVGVGYASPVENAKNFLLEHLDEFLEIYQNRPDADPANNNSCGNGSNNNNRLLRSLAIFTVAKQLQPTTIVESGVNNSGQSTYFFRAACPKAKIISIDPLSKPTTCGGGGGHTTTKRWMDNTNNEYLTGDDSFVDFDAVNWGERIQSSRDNNMLDPATTLVFLDDKRGFLTRFPTLAKFGFRHILNDDSYTDRPGLTSKQVFGAAAPAYSAAGGGGASADTAEWLFRNVNSFAEFPPLIPSSSSLSPTTLTRESLEQNTNELMAMEEPLLRPDMNAQDKHIIEKIARELGLDPTMKDYQSYLEFSGYSFITYMELAAPPPQRLRRNYWSLFQS